MAIGVKINFASVYDIESASSDLRLLSFDTQLIDGETVRLKIEISNIAHELMPNVYNLAFGPMNSKGKIDDKAELPHKSYCVMHLPCTRSSAPKNRRTGL